MDALDQLTWPVLRLPQHTRARRVRQIEAADLDQRVEREGPSAPIGRANVQARIAEELATDPTRSERAIAAVVGCDHKTVAKARKTTATP